jgi:beta-lactamase regulating signal transducer with metallopeptidase domain
MTVFEPSTLLPIALKTSVLVVAVGLIACGMGKRSAAWRHLLWTCALALSLAMPVAVVYLPSYVQVTLPWPSTEPLARDEPVPVAGEVRRVGARPDDLGPRASGLSNAQRQGRAPWPAVTVLWLVGAVIVLLRNLLAHIGLMRWVRQSRSGLSPAWAATLRQVMREAGIRRCLRVLESDQASGPCTWGLAQPVLLLPSAGADWPEPQRRFALLHELAHVRRFDYLTTQIANLACAVHWYNPLVWFAAARARKLQEQACDDAVLQAGGMASEYAGFLVSIADGSRRFALTFPAAVGMVQRSQLHGRVTAILDASRARLPLSGLALVFALVPLACLMLFLATVSAIASPMALRQGVPLEASFSSVELRNGGTVNLVHGASQRVTLVKGDAKYSEIRIRDDGRLVIDRCPKSCPHRHDFEVEVVTPALAAVAVAEGGTLQSRGRFPDQPEIDASVSQGGRLDIRSMSVANVKASVYSGGRIFVKPTTSLSARIEQGGNVTYWGDIVVTSSIEFGGVVVEGDVADADKPLAAMDPTGA